MMTAARGLALIYSDGRPISRLTDEYNFFGLERTKIKGTDALPPGEALVLYRALTDAGAPSAVLLRVTRMPSGIVVAY